VHEVLRDEGVAVVPTDALSKVQPVLRGIVSGRPAFAERTGDGAVAVEQREVVQPAAAEIRQLRPVPQPRVFSAFVFMLMRIVPRRVASARAGVGIATPISP
jgi:hypothetical protein